MLSREDTKTFYDRFGAKQDSQAFYEDVAIGDLLEHLDLSHACVLFEFGCGTGRFAERVLEDRLPGNSWYRGVDISETMTRLTGERIRRFGDRATVKQSDGAPVFDAPDRSVDAVVSNYVLDILPERDIHAFVAECGRVLSDDGQLGLISLTHGATILSHAVIALWRAVYGIRPATLGGCRPIELREFLPENDWQTLHRRVIVSRGIPSEIVVAKPKR